MSVHTPASSMSVCAFVCACVQLDGPAVASKGLVPATMGKLKLKDVDDPMHVCQLLCGNLAYRVVFSGTLRCVQGPHVKSCHAAGLFSPRTRSTLSGTKSSLAHDW